MGLGAGLAAVPVPPARADGAGPSFPLQGPRPEAELLQGLTVQRPLGSWHHFWALFAKREWRRLWDLLVAPPTFPLRAPWEGRAGWLNPALAPWLFSQLQAEAGSVCKVQTGSVGAFEIHSSNNSNNSCRLLRTHSVPGCLG